MLRVDRTHIEGIKQALQAGMQSGRTANANLKVSVPMASDVALERAALMALNSLGVDLFGVHEVVTPSDVTHMLSNSIDGAIS